MIIKLLLDIVYYILSVVLSIVPAVKTIPFVDSYLVSGFSYFTAILVEVPPLQVVWQCFVWYMLFKIGIMVIKFFVGHRINI